ncbi:MAG TPA: DUF1570 domain-containing protein [Kofleriaceae bacterium]|nr:DUF1570 domain-containing protein [Kofleriaceae bacterium]
MVDARWSLLIVLAIACGPVIPPLPSRGGPAWFELKSEHFILWTDASAARGRELVRQMEHHRQIVMRVMNNVPSKVRSFVIALRNAREVAAYLPKQFSALAWGARGPTRQPGILLASDTQAREHAINHELTHVISSGIFANQPHWFAEGLATYFETAELEPGATHVKVGLPREDHASFLLTSAPRSAAELFACEEQRCMDEAFYATSWALFSFLVNEHTDQLIYYLRRMQEVPENKQAELWRDVFPELSPDKLDHLLKQWLVSGNLAMPLVEVNVQDFPATERQLGDGDVLAARSLLDVIFTRDSSAMRANLAAALAIDGTNVLARLVQAALTNSITPDDARATAAAHPDDWRAWWLVGFAVRNGPEATEALDKLCALAANEAPECAHLADHRGAAHGSSK